MRFSYLALIVALSAPVIAGQVRVVGPLPAPYQTVQDALSSAQEDDIVLVKTGSYEYCRTVGRSVTVIADTGANVQIGSAVRVIDLPADKLVVVSGINGQGKYSSTLTELRSGIHVEDALGQVVVQDCHFQSATQYVQVINGCERYSMGGGANVRTSSGVAFTRCLLEGISLTRNTAAGLQVQLPSFVSCDSVVARGTDGGLIGPIICGTYGDGYDGRAGIDMVRAFPSVPGAGFLFAADTTTIGGIGGDADTTYCGSLCGGCYCPGRGGDGFRGIDPNSQFALLACTGLPGVGGQTHQSGAPQCDATGPSGQPVYLGVSHCFAMAPATPASQLAGSARKLSGSTLVRDNQLATLSFAGQPGEIVELAVSSKAATFVYQPSNGGVLHVPNPPWTRVGIVANTGSLVRGFKMRDLPLNSPGMTLVAQARFRDPMTGATRLSNVHVIVVVDKVY